MVKHVISLKDLTLGNLLGKGGFGVVYQGKWQHSDVAIKQILNTSNLTPHDIKSFEEEAAMMSHLRHPNIVTFYGVCLEPKHYSMVVEFMVKGTLYDVLHKAPSLPWSKRIQIALDICRGLLFLHSHNPPIVHRDMKSVNVLMDEKLNAKISDFGMAKIRRLTMDMPHGVEGTYAYMAPEILLNGHPGTQESDVYALGVILWEIATRKDPHCEIKSILHKIKLGKRDPIPDETPPIFRSMIERCWAQDRKDRPQVREVYDVLSQLNERDDANSNANADELKVIPYHHLKILEEMGCGSFGVVRKANWMDCDVAYKELKQELLGSLTKRHLEDFKLEAKRHSNLKHSQIVTLYGVVLEEKHYGLILEWMVRGSLFRVLHQLEETLPWKIRLQIAKDICDAVLYLHSQKPPIIHRDIKSANVLLDRSYRAKLCDFGLARIKTVSVSTLKKQKGTMLYLAPEMLNGGSASEASDIYAMGLVFWELASGCMPYEDVENEFQLKKKIQDGVHDPIPRDTPPRFAALIGRCWAQRTQDRPSASFLTMEMDNILR